LIAERDAIDALSNQGVNLMLDQCDRPVILETAGKPPAQIDRPIGGAQQHRPGVRGHRAAVKRRHNIPPLDGCKAKQIRDTLCQHRGTPLEPAKSFLQNNFRRFSPAIHLRTVRNAGACRVSEISSHKNHYVLSTASVLVKEADMAWRSAVGIELDEAER